MYTTTPDPLLIVDGMNVVMRQATAMTLRGAEVTRQEICSMSLNMIAAWAKHEGRPLREIVVVFDGERGKDQRLAIYPAYKGNRGEKDAAIRPAIVDLMVDLLDCGAEVMRPLHWEADDVMATLATRAAKQGRPSILFTSDGDLQQALVPGVTIRDPKRATWGDPAMTHIHFALRWGFPPHLLADFKALAGDASDNIPGLPGVGKGIAQKLINGYGSLEEIFAGLWQIPIKYKKHLDGKRADALRWRSITALNRDVPL